ncbi:MAG: radical SAM protein [Thermodesulfobacteriota bacterium]|nr:radical SAM protein [Thermodesulfobacteriota bacterium]
MTCLGDQLGMEFSPKEIAAARARNGLLSMELELSRTCNLRCVYCYASSGKPLENELNLAEIEDVVEQAVQLGAKKIIVLGGGEPLLYPQLLEVLDCIIHKKSCG